MSINIVPIADNDLHSTTTGEISLCSSGRCWYFGMDTRLFRPTKKKLVACHMPKKVRVGRSDFFSFLIFFSLPKGIL